MTDRTLLDLYREHAQRQGRRACFVLPSPTEPGQVAAEIGYETLYRSACQIERYLESAKLEAGTRVVLLHHRAWQAFPLLAACAARGVTMVPLNPDLHPDELTDILRHADPRVIVGDLTSDRLPSYSRAERVLTLEALMTAAADYAAEPSGVARAAEHPALIIYTSGTTGGSKAVMLSERALLFAAASTARFYELVPEDRIYGVVPYHHMNAVMASGLIPITAGAQIVVGDSFGFTNAKFYWQTIRDLNVTICSLIPSIMSMLIKLNPHGAPAGLVDNVRFAWCGAAPLPESLWRQFEETFGIPVYQGYGLTETSFWTVCIPPNVSRHYNTVGMPVDCEIRIDRDILGGNDPDRVKRAAWLAPEQTDSGSDKEKLFGEVLMRSGGLMDGYYRNKKLTDAVMTQDGFLRTGDIGYLDPDGYLRIVGRKKEVIIRNGINILPDEIDAAIATHPAVKECKTIGLPDELLGERIVNVCVLKDEAASGDRSAAIRAYAREHLSGFKRPDEVIVMPYLPRGTTGKISSGTLRRIVSGELVDEIMKALLKRKFRRAEPSDLTAMRDVVRRAVRTGAPIKYLKYWGCGDRDHMNDADREALESLQELIASASLIPEVQATLTLVLNNMHARINGRVPERAASYLHAVADAARALGFTVEFEADVWEQGGLRLDDMRAEADTPAAREWFNQLPIHDKLLEQAGKHSRLLEPQEAARVYATACRHANTVLETRYPDHIFLTYNPPEMDIVSPNLPKQYIYPARRGASDKPWFAA